MRFIAVTDGAYPGLIDTARIFPTTSSGGIAVFSRATTATHPMMMGTARRRIRFAGPIGLGLR
ncbi:hypothetical protein MINS_08800 [Mycolicibacterium insubricum]|jgi:hypothetical protein|nr:hypothetical protein MINS_08800 [Mycolicibacterium insubricum]